MEAEKMNAIGKRDPIVLEERVRTAEERSAEAIAETYKWKELWNAAASCLQHNKAKIKPRGQDERRMLEAADKCTCGHYWSGKTNGWLPEIE